MNETQNILIIPISVQNIYPLFQSVQKEQTKLVAGTWMTSGHHQSIVEIYFQEALCSL